MPADLPHDPPAAAMGWPDPKRPGVPLEPEKDGLHVVAVLGNLTAYKWHAKELYWGAGIAPEHFSRYVAKGYFGPVRTDADVRAAGAAGFVKAREASARICTEMATAWDMTGDRLARIKFCLDAERINALPVPDANALAEFEARVRAEEREAIAAWHDAQAVDFAARARYFRSPAGRRTNSCGLGGAEAAARDYEQLSTTHRDAAAAIRARAGGGT